jgi:hypothetical protein
VQARTRLENARKFFEVAELAAAEKEIPSSRSVAAALAVLSGIAAADAACCALLDRRSGGEDLGGPGAHGVIAPSAAIEAWHPA